jgi:hypothetical protein
MLATVEEYMTAAFTQVSHAVQQTIQGCCSIRKDIDTFIDAHLHYKVAFVAKNALTGLPATLALLFLPDPIPSGLVITYWVIQVITSIIPRSVSIPAETGLAMYLIAEAIKPIALFILTGDGVTAVTGFVAGFTGWLVLPTLR